jgi:hypothetical protein
MPIRMLIAIVVGTILAFGWGAVSWTSGMYDFAFKPLPDGAAVAAGIDSSVTADGAYLYPAPPATAGLSPQQATIANDAFVAEHRRGPLLMALVRREGVDPMSPTVLARGFVIELFGTALLAAIIAVACKFGARTQDRLALAVAIPAFAMLSSHAVMWNFFHLPDLYSIVLFADGMAAWTLAGIACALIIRPEGKTKA